MIYDAIRAVARSVGEEERVRALADQVRGVGRVLTSRSVPLHRNERICPFFIVGSGRCGTTLLRRLLQASPEVHIPPENWTFGACLANFRAYRCRLSWEGLMDCLLCRHVFENDRWFENLPTDLRLLLHSLDPELRSLARFYDEVYQYHGEIRGAKFERWGDKTPANIWNMERLLSIFPHAEFVHLVRDAVDVVHSWSKIEKYRGEVVRPARRWKSAVTTAQEFAQEHPSRIHEVRYEDLCRSPEKTLKKVYQFVGLSYDTEVLSRTEHYDEMQGAKSISHYQNAFKPISTDSIGQGRRRLTSVQKEKIVPIIGEELARQGYNPVQP